MLTLTVAELEFLIKITEDIAPFDKTAYAANILGKLKHERHETMREEREKEEADAIDAGTLDPVLTDEEYAIAERRRKHIKEGGHGGWGTWYEHPDDAG